MDKTLPPPAPPKSGGEKKKSSPSLIRRGLGGGRNSPGTIHNKQYLKVLRQSLRNEATPAERLLWRELRQSSLQGYKFRRQHSVGNYILDFYCPSERLAVELDGDSHFSDEALKYDRERTAFLNSLNIRVIRFLNTDVYENIDAVREKIVEEIRKGKPTTPDPS